MTRADAVSYIPKADAGDSPNAICGLLHSRNPVDPNASPRPLRVVDNASWRTSDLAYWALSCGFPDESAIIGSEDVWGELCAASCANTMDCTHFAWTPEGGNGTCTHRRGKAARKNAVVIDQPKAACGLLRSKVEEEIKQRSRRLNTAEIIGICTGVLGALGTLAGVLVAIRKREVIVEQKTLNSKLHKLELSQA